jgi:transcriptional regulator with XRE-family HTH domain
MQHILTERAVDVAFGHWQQARTDGRKLEWLRELAGVSQTVLAAYVGISPRTLARIEKGERALSGPERVLVAKALGGSLTTFCSVRVSPIGSRNGTPHRVGSRNGHREVK